MVRWRVSRGPWVSTALLCGLALLSCGAPNAGKGQGNPVGEAATANEAGAKMAPDFALKDLDGNVVHLSDTAGQVRLVDFWTTWCKPCIEEVPMFKELDQTYGERGFALIAISMDDDGAKVVRPVVDELQVPYVNLIGNDEVADGFGGIFGFPTAYLLDGDGRIVERYVGPKPRKVLEKRIRELLGLDPTA